MPMKRNVGRTVKMTRSASGSAGGGAGAPGGLCGGRGVTAGGGGPTAVISLSKEVRTRAGESAGEGDDREGPAPPREATRVASVSAGAPHEPQKRTFAGMSAPQ